MKTKPKTLKDLRNPRTLRRVVDNIPPLTAKLEIIEAIRGEIRMYAESYIETDGVIRNEGAIHTIAALKGAHALLSKEIGWISPALQSAMKNPAVGRWPKNYVPKAFGKTLNP